MIAILAIFAASAQPDVLEPLFSRGGGVAGRNISLDFGGRRVRNPSLLFSLPASANPYRLSLRRLTALNSLSSLMRSSPHLSGFAFDMSNCAFRNFLATPVALQFAQVLVYKDTNYNGDSSAIQRGSVCSACPQYDSATISNCQFTNCRTSGTGDFMNGGGLGFTSANEIRVESCTFTGCVQQSATECADPGCGGGAVYVSSSMKLIITKSSMTSCQADCGGGVWAYQVGSVEIDNTKMVQCSSSKKEGGGMRCDGAGSYRGAFVSFQSCSSEIARGVSATFVSVQSFHTDTNATGSAGANAFGALFFDKGNLEMHFSKFTGNAGYCTFYISNVITTDMSRTLFSSNTNQATTIYLYATTAQCDVRMDHLCFEGTDLPITLFQEKDSGSIQANLVDCYFSGTLTYDTGGSVTVQTDSLHTSTQVGQCDAHTATLSMTFSESESDLPTLETTSDEGGGSEVSPPTTPTSEPVDPSTGTSGSSGVEPTDPTPTPAVDGGKKANDKIGIIVGSIIAVIIVVVVVTLLVMCCMWRCRKSAIMKSQEVSDREVLAFPTL